MPYVLTEVRRIVLVGHDVDRREGPFESAADRIEAVKVACARLRLRYTSALVHDALERIDQERLRKGQPQSVQRTTEPEPIEQFAGRPVSAKDAAAVLEQLGLRVSGGRLSPRPIRKSRLVPV
jgi:hypothetical protein